MKFTSIFFRSERSILEFYLKDTNKRTNKHPKLQKIYFNACKDVYSQQARVSSSSKAD